MWSIPGLRIDQLWLVLLALAGGAAIGFLFPLQPILAYAVAAVPMVVVLLAARPWVLVLLTVLAPWVSRLLTTTGLAPRIVDFADFGLVLLLIVSAVVARLGSGEQLPRERIRILQAIGAFAGVIVLSAIVNGAPAERLFAGLLLTLEPFLLLAALLLATPDAVGRKYLIGALALICASQIPFAIVQSLGSTNPDDVKGTLLGTGAGHHVMAGGLVVGLFAAVALVRRPLLLTGIAVVVLIVGVLADAKQVMIPAPIAYVAATVFASRRSIDGRRILTAILLTLGFGLVVYTMAPIEAAIDMVQRTNDTGGGKPALTRLIFSDLAADPLQGAFGFGPGETVSRFGYLTTLLESDGSPTEAIGLGPGSLTESYDQAVASAGYIADSSFSSGQSSLLGIAGDYGFLGLIAAGWMIWTIVDELRRVGTALSQSAIAAWVLVIPLAYIFDWLEQPPFMLLIALVTGLALTEVGSAEATQPSSSLISPILHQARSHILVVAAVAIVAGLGAWSATQRQDEQVIASIRLVVVDDADAFGRIVDGESAQRRVQYVDAMARSAAFVEETAELDSIAPVSVKTDGDIVELFVLADVGEAERLVEDYADALLEILDRPYNELVLEQIELIDGRTPEAGSVELVSFTSERGLLARQLALEERREELLGRSRVVGSSVVRDGSVLVEPVSEMPAEAIIGLASILGAAWSVSLLSIRHLSRERIFSVDDLLRSYGSVQPIDWSSRPIDAESPGVRAIARRLLSDLPILHGNEVTVVDLGRSRATSHVVAEHLARALDRESQGTSSIRVSNSQGRDAHRGAAGLVLLVEKGEVALAELDRLVAEWSATGTTLMGLVLLGRTPESRDGRWGRPA